MAMSRTEALIRLLDDLQDYAINATHYYEDSEPQAFYDTHLSGKLDALVLFCQRFSWSGLADQLQKMLPLNGNAISALTIVQDFILPEIRQNLEQVSTDTAPDPNEAFWQLLHPRISALARPRFDGGFYGDAVESCFKAVNEAVKRIYQDATGKEADGAGLMTSAFSVNGPAIKLTDLKTQSDRDEQQGYMSIYAGAMTGIRNPKAHGNLNPDPRRTLHLISLASLLMLRIDERVS